MDSLSRIVMVVLTSLFCLLFIEVTPCDAARPIASAGEDRIVYKNRPLGASLTLDGTGSLDPAGDTLEYRWHGPFSHATGQTPLVVVPEGGYTVSLLVDNGDCPSRADTATIKIVPGFSLSARQKGRQVSLTWPHRDGTDRYDIYRAEESDPFQFEKIAETTNTYSTYLDRPLTDQTTYLYVVGALFQGQWRYSNVVSSRPVPRKLSRLNCEPVIYSSPVGAGTVGILYNYGVCGTDPGFGKPLVYALGNHPPGMTIDSSSGLISWTPDQPGVYEVSVEVSDGIGGSDTQSFVVDVSENPVLVPEVDLSSDPAAVSSGDSSTLVWSSSHACTCEIDHGVGAVPVDGTLVVSPSETTTYTVTATGPGGIATARVTVAVAGPPSVEMNADPGIILGGRSSLLEWTSADALRCFVEPGVGEVDPDGSTLVCPSETTTYTITAAGPGGTATADATVSVSPPPPAVTLAADPETIEAGRSTTLKWHSENAESCTVDQGVGAVALDSSGGGRDVLPDETTTYTITAVGPGGTSTARVVVTVSPAPPTVAIEADPGVVRAGESSRLTWNSTHADSCVIDHGVGSAGLNSRGEGLPVSPADTTTYTIYATGPGGLATASATVVVTDPEPPSVCIQADPPIVVPGNEELGSSLLTWSSEHADSCVVDQGIGSVPLESGEEDGIIVSPSKTTAYTITATGPGGTATAVVVVRTDAGPPTVSIWADPEIIDPSGGEMGGASRLSWTSTHAETCEIDQGIGEVHLESGEEHGVTVSPEDTTVYTITAAGPGGAAMASTAVGVVGSRAPSVSIWADPGLISPGQPAVLCWDSSYADSCVMDQGIGTVWLNSGEVPLEVTPMETTTYTITATGPGGTARASVTVAVQGFAEPTTIDFRATPGTIQPGESACLSWTSSNADSCEIDQGIGSVPLNSSGNGFSVTPAATTTYTITASGPAGTVTSAVTVSVGGAPAPMAYPPLALRMIRPDGSDDPADNRFTIRWVDEGFEGATVSLFYDADDSGADGTLITSGLPVGPDGPGGDAHVWDASLVPEGRYYVYAMIEDGLHDPVTDYSDGPVFIDHGLFPGTGITSDDAAQKAELGASVSIDGEYAILGAPGDGTIPGAAYVFKLDGTQWIKQTKILPGDSAVGDLFGGAVALDGEYAVVGAPGAWNEADQAGKVYVFKRCGASWVEQAVLKSVSPVSCDRFGVSVSMSGGFIVAGAPGRGAGYATAFKQNNDGLYWQYNGTITPSDGADGDRFGAAVSVDGRWLSIGAPGDADDAGSLYLFKLEKASWYFEELWVEHSKYITDEASQDRFGSAVFLKGADLFVGAPGNEDNRGAVYVLNGADGAWGVHSTLTAGGGLPGDLFGSSMATCGDYMIVGAAGDGPGGEKGAEAAYLFKRKESTWNEIARLKAVGSQTGDGYGGSVSITSGYALVGAGGDSEYGPVSGAAYFHPIGTEDFEPWFDFLRPVGSHEPAHTSYRIEWIDADPDSNAHIDIYYDEDKGGADGTLIKAGIPEDPDGEGYDELLWETTHIPNGSYYIYAVINDGAEEPLIAYSQTPVTIDHTMTDPKNRFMAAPGGKSQGDRFGCSVSMNGDWAVIGASGDDGNGPNSGAVYVYQRDASGWRERARLTASDGMPGDSFGHSVAVDGDYAVVGAVNSGQEINDDLGLQGAAYFFKRGRNGWFEQEKIYFGKNFNDIGTGFGCAVALSGDWAIVGAGAHRISSGYSDRRPGGAFLFRREGERWVPLDKLGPKPYEDSAGSGFGSAVAIHGDYAIVGAPLFHEAYIYEREGYQWVQRAKFARSGRFGSSVAISDEYAVVGAELDNIVYVFKRDGSLWSPHAELALPRGASSFGGSVSILGNHVIVGDESADGSHGLAYVFERDGDTWSMAHKFFSPDGSEGDLFGSSVALSDNYALVGAEGRCDHRGAACFMAYHNAFMKADPTTIHPGEFSTLSWNTNHAESVTIEPGIGDVNPDGGAAVAPQKTTTYTLTGTGPWGTRKATETIHVVPRVSFSVKPATTMDGQSTTLSWEVTDADTVAIDHGIGGVPFTGTREVSPSGTTIFTLTASRPGGRATEGVQVQVLDPAAANEIFVGPEDSGRRFGYAVDVDGDQAVVGMPWDNDDGFASGSAYIYRRDGLRWVKDAKILPGHGSAWAEFGRSVSISGDYALVSAFVFKREGTAWVEKAHLPGGSACAVCGEVAIVGDYKEGTASIYRRDGEAWNLQARIQPDDGVLSFGWAVDITRDYAVIGAPAAHDYAGAVYIFRREGAQWIQEAGFGGTKKSVFGWDVAVEGDHVVIGEPSVGKSAGRAHVYKKEGVVWVKESTLYADDQDFYDSFGKSVSMSNGYIVAGAPNDMDAGLRSGSIYVFRPAGGEWFQIEKITSGRSSEKGSFGFAVAISGDDILTGAYGEGGTTGGAYFHSLMVLEPEVDLQASPAAVEYGEPSILSWTSSRARGAAIEPGLGDFGPSGSVTVTPEQTTTYTITAQGPGGSAFDTAQVTVIEHVPEAGIRAVPVSIRSGETTVVSWESTHADTLVIEPHFGAVDDRGSVILMPEKTTTYTLTATGRGGECAAEITVHVSSSGYAYGDPTPAEQAHLERINRARLDPPAEAARLGVALNEGLAPGTLGPDPRQPVTFNANLLQAARLHAKDMIDRRFCDHDNPDGIGPQGRVAAQGFLFAEMGENLAAALSNQPRDDLSVMLGFHDMLFIDEEEEGRGHRKNILDNRFKEAGLGAAHGEYDGYPHASMFTCDYGASSEVAESFLLGAVYDDRSSNGLYDAGEGLGNVAIVAHGTGYFTRTASAGGYGMLLPPGEYTVSATLPDGRGTEKACTINEQNVKVDFTLNEFKTLTPQASLQAGPAYVLTGGSARLFWTSAHATAVTIEPGIGQVEASGSQVITPEVDTTYTITASGPGGRTTDTVRVPVFVETPLLDVSIAADPEVIQPGDDTTLAWTSTDAESCSIEPGIGLVSKSGSLSVSPAATTTYTATATSRGLSVSDSATVRVAAQPLVQGLVVEEAVFSPVQGVTVSIEDSDRTQTTLTDSNGWYLVGGVTPGPVAVTFSKDGWLREEKTLVIHAGRCEVLDMAMNRESALHTARLEGTVKDAATGNPVSGATVSVADPVKTQTARTNPDGTYYVSGIELGDAEIVVSKEGYFTATSPVAFTEGFTLYTVDFEMTTEAFRLKGRILDAATGDPLAGATVSVSNPLGVQTVQSLADGAYLIDEVDLANAEIVVSADGYLSRSGRLHYPEKKTHVLDVALHDAAHLVEAHGTVTNTRTLEPESGVTLTLDGTEVFAVSAQDGSFSLNVPMGGQTFKVFKEGFADRTVKFDINTEPLEMDLYLPTRIGVTHPAEIDSSITGLVYDSRSGQPIPGAVVLVDSYGNQATTDADGEFALTGLPLGPITLMAMAEGYDAVYTKPTVVPGASDYFSLNLPCLREGVIEGRVIDGDTGDPIHGAGISLGENSLLGALTEGDGTYKMIRVPMGTHTVTFSHPAYGTVLKDNIVVGDGGAATADCTLIHKPETGSLEGMVADRESGSPVAGVALEVEGSSIAGTTGTNGRYVLNGLPAGLVKILIGKTGYPSTSRTTAVVADRDHATPTITTFDIELDAKDPTPPDSTSERIVAAEGGTVETPDKRFMVHFPPGALSGDAIVTLGSPAGGPDVLPGEDLALDPELGVDGIKALGKATQLFIEPAIEGAPVPTVQGWVVVSGRYFESEVDAFNIEESSVFPYCWDGTNWTVLRVKPHEMAVDEINNTHVSALDFSVTETGDTISKNYGYKEPLLLASLLPGVSDNYGIKFLFLLAGALSNKLIISNACIYDKDEILAAIHPENEINKPNENALPLLIIHGWDMNSLWQHVDHTDPNMDPRFKHIVEDIINSFNGVYRPMFATYNTRAGIFKIANEMVEQYLEKRITGKKPDALEGQGDGEFPYMDTFGFSAGGLISRCFQSLYGGVHDMVIVATPNHGTHHFVKHLEPLNSIAGVWSPGTADLLPYDDDAFLPYFSGNPTLYLLNKSKTCIPMADMTLIAGTDGFLDHPVLLGKNDRVVPVDSVFCRTSSLFDAEDASLLMVNENAVKYECEAHFNHKNFGTENYRINQYENVKTPIIRGFSDWVVSELVSSSIEKYPAGFIKAAAFECRVEYNVWGRDCDAFVPVLYGRDKHGRYHIYGNSVDHNGHVTQRQLIYGNSADVGSEEVLLVTNFNESDEIESVSLSIVALKPGQNKINLIPAADFGMPESGQQEHL